MRDDAGALRVLTMATGSPALTQGDVVDVFRLSKKAAQKAISTLEEAGAIAEITGRSDWRVWLANDQFLSPPLANIGAYSSRPSPDNPFGTYPKLRFSDKLYAIDVESREAELNQAMAEADEASKKLRDLTKKYVA